jgi:hypothetical protein
MRGIPWLGARRLATFVSVIGLVVGYGSAAGASSAAIRHARLTPAARALAAARSELRHLTVGEHGTVRLAGTAHADGIRGQTPENSTNWSGYADNNADDFVYSSIAGNWTQPLLLCGPGENSLALFWIGLDGLGSSTVEQAGTAGECYEGASYYFTWWEMYPSNNLEVVGDAVHSGDSISASVTDVGGSYDLTVTDTSTPSNSFTTTQTCSSCTNSSAEWIVEAASSSTGAIQPLSDFGSWTVTDATVAAGSDSGNISTFQYDVLTMVTSAGAVQVEPSALSDSGGGFTATWEGTPPPPPREVPLPPPHGVQPPSRQPPPP